MKTCEECGGAGCRPIDRLICGRCFGTGWICLGHESEARYAGMVEQAREKAARLGWIEEVWEPLTEVERRAQYPRLARKVYRAITVPQQHKRSA